MKNKNKEAIFDIYVQAFNIFCKTKKLNNPSFYPDQRSIKESIEQTNSMLEETLTVEEKEFIIKRIESVYNIFQEEGSVILGDYEHDYDWYKKLCNSKKYKEYYWPRYKDYLIRNNNLPPRVLDVLENDTLPNLMSYLGNPNDESQFSIRGLVVGDVQSGKTSNYLGLITKASDAGYKVVFILTGTIESLRRQTQQRVEEGYVGFDSFNGLDVGVGRGDDKKMPKAFTSRAKDFTSNDYQNTTYRISDYQHMIFVVKKNVSVLKKIYSSLKRINTSSRSPKINYPMLMIDDEADNASINTNKADNDPTKINNYIRNILSLFTKTSYIGFTATPFANVFINYDSYDDMLGNDLFPKNFIYALKSPTNYCGSKKYFFSENENVRYILDADPTIFPIKHKKDWEGNKLFNSLYHSINVFAIANAIRDIRDANKNTHRSMLINMSRFTNVQGVIKQIVEEYFYELKKTVRQCHKLNRKLALTNPLIKSLKESFTNEYSNCKVNGKSITWDEIFNVLYDSIKNVKIVVVNSSKQSEKINYADYDKEGLRVIAIGGLALSRGLTLEGLVVSYFFRNTATFDVLMQMGRWFGYREGYGDLCKIFITKDSASYYKEICYDIEYFKNDIERMHLQHKTPKDYGIRIRNASIDLSITAANKMRNTKIRVIRKSCYGNVFETPYLHRDLKIIKSNIEETFRFLSKIDISQKDKKIQHPYFRNIKKDIVINFIKNIKLHPANEDRFNINEVLKFINKKDVELNVFDVLVMGGSSDMIVDYTPLGIHVPLVKRKFDTDGKIIRVNKQRAHLMGRSDTKYGLSLSEQKNIADYAPAQDYMIEGRNPLLIIYLVDLKNDPNDEDYIDIFANKDDKFEYVKLLLDKCAIDLKFAVGFALCFPKKDGEDVSTTLFTVNKTADYFENDHEQYLGDDENE